MVRSLLIAAIFCLPALASAQSLTPEQIAAMVDEKVNAQNPYAELLNNQDPARSLAAMEIMLESGDPKLTRMALEFGLLSTNPSVKRTALESYLNSKPVLSFRFDGSETESTWFDSAMKGGNATMTPERIGYWNLQVGDFDDAQRCYAHAGRKECFITVTPDGVLWRTSNGRTTGRFDIGEGGVLEGSSLIYNVNTPVPTSAKLLD